jgi:MFS family permease
MINSDYTAAIRYSQIARKITGTLFAAGSLGSAGFIATFTISSIVGAKLSGHPAWAGVPSAIYLLGSAFAAYGWGYGMDRLGRRAAFALGAMSGAIGAGLAGAAVISQSFVIFLGGMVLMGMANAAWLLGRFAAAEVHPPTERGRAISNVVIAGTVVAVFGPLTVGPTGWWAQQTGLDELVGPYAISLILFLVAALTIFIWLRPDPREVGREIAKLYPETGRRDGLTRSISAILRDPAVIVAMTAMVLGQAVMVMLMVITSLHMKDHQHHLADISIVISSHMLGMYAFSIISGRLADQWGRGPVILAGAMSLILACLTAPLSVDVLPISVSLFLLGLGWNFCYVGGSSLLSDQLSPAERAKTQGFNDLLIGLASAAGSLGSGIVFAAVGYGAMGTAGTLTALIPVGLTIWWRTGRRAPATAP